MRGWAAVGGRRLAVDAAGLVDESAGYHARHTAWRWSAGVGVAESGEPVAWNLVAGLHDAPAASERTVWVAGEPREVGPVRFGAAARPPARDAARGHLRPISPPSPPPDGVALRFTAEAARSRGASGCWSSRPTTSSRSGASPASCPAPGGCARAGA